MYNTYIKYKGYQPNTKFLIVKNGKHLQLSTTLISEEHFISATFCMWIVLTFLYKLLFFCGLFYDAFSGSHHTCWMAEWLPSDELEGVWKEAVVA
jgi:hypothetical protein